MTRTDHCCFRRT